jgi:hypothetical protein
VQSQGSGVSGSAVYDGRVIHQRHAPRTHRLEYRVFSLLLDLDELGELDRRLRLFGCNRAGFFSFHDSDHGDGDGRSAAAWARAQLARAGFSDTAGPVYLLCYPRVLGYVFNPLSVYYCHSSGGQLQALIYEVGNTFGERHSYVIPANSEHGTVRHACDKEFYVSPFLPMNCRYNFRARTPGKVLSLLIRETHDERPVLDAWFSAHRKTLNDRTLLLLGLSLPFLTLKVIAGIHWEALKLWLKGLPVYRHSRAPEHTVSLAPGNPD